MSSISSNDRPDGRSGPTSVPALRQVARLAFLASAAVLTAFSVHTATCPIGGGCLVANLGVYDELFAQAWDEFGFLRSLGVPMVGCVGETVAERVPYAHQAPIGWWPPYFGRTLFGKGPLGLKFFPALFCALGALLLFVLVRSRAGPGWAALAVALFIAWPVIQLYAGLPGIESIAFLAAAGVIWSWERWRTEPSARRRWQMTAVFLAGTQFAWSFYFTAPGLLLAELFRPPNERQFRPLFRLFLLGLFGFALVITHLLLGTRSVGVVLGDVLGTARDVFIEGVTKEREFLGTRLTFASAQAQRFLENLGPVGGSLAAISLILVLASRRWRGDPLSRVAAVFLVQGALTVIVFNARSNTHGYYWFLMAPGATLFLIQGARAATSFLRQRLGVLAPAPALGLLAFGVSFGFAQHHPVQSQCERPGLETFAAQVDRAVPSGNWICSMDEQSIEWMLCSSRRWTPPLPTPDTVARVLAARQAGKARFDLLYLYVTPSTQSLLPELCSWLEGLVQVQRARRLLAEGGRTLYVL